MPHRIGVGASIAAMLHPRDIELAGDAVAALTQILAIMADEVMRSEEPSPRWDVGHLAEVEYRLGVVVGIDDVAPPPAHARMVTLGIDDVALLLDGMAFTEIFSVDLPWFELVQWTSDFVTAELRGHWSEDEWRAWSAR